MSTKAFKKQTSETKYSPMDHGDVKQTWKGKKLRMLELDDKGRNNIMEFREQLDITAAAYYPGPTGECIRAGQYLFPPETVVPEKFTFDDEGDMVENPTFEGDLVRYQFELEERGKFMPKHRDQMPALYHLIWEHLSERSRTELHKNARFQDIQRSRDPLELWKVVLVTHLNQVDDDPALQEVAAMKALVNYKMSDKELLYEGLNRYLDILERFQQAGGFAKADELKDNIAVWLYVDGLTELYAQYKADLRNGIKTGLRDLPTTPQATFTQVSNYLVVKGNAIVQVTNQTVFHTSDDKKPKKKKGKGAKNDKSKDAVASEAKGDPKPENKKKQKDKSHIKCFKCQQMGHYSSECKAADTGLFAGSNTDSDDDIEDPDDMVLCACLVDPQDEGLSEESEESSSEDSSDDFGDLTDLASYTIAPEGDDTCVTEHVEVHDLYGRGTRGVLGQMEVTSVGHIFSTDMTPVSVDRGEPREDDATSRQPRQSVAGGVITYNIDSETVSPSQSPPAEAPDCGEANRHKRRRRCRRGSRRNIVSPDQVTLVAVADSKRRRHLRNVMILDSGTTKHIFQNPLTLVNIRQSDDPVTLYGLINSLEVTEEGDDPVLGRVYYNPKASANLVSKSLLVNSPGVWLTYDNSPPRRRYDIYYFDELVFVFDLNPKTGLWECDLDTDRLQTTLLAATVEQAKSKYTIREVYRAQEVMDAIERFACASFQDLKTMVKHGTMKDLTFSRDDFFF